MSKNLKVAESLHTDQEDANVISTAVNSSDEAGKKMIKLQEERRKKSRSRREKRKMSPSSSSFLSSSSSSMSAESENEIVDKRLKIVPNGKEFKWNLPLSMAEVV